MTDSDIYLLSVPIIHHLSKLDAENYLNSKSFQKHILHTLTYQNLSISNIYIMYLVENQAQLIQT
jgi:hypothetical protein